MMDFCQLQINVQQTIDTRLDEEDEAMPGIARTDTQEV